MPKRGGCTITYRAHTKYRDVWSYGRSKQKCGITEKFRLEEITWSNPPPFLQAAQTTSEQYVGLENKWLVNTSDH